MRVLYIFRNPVAGFSIAKVFREIVGAVPGASRIELPVHGGSPSKLIRNLFYLWRHRQGQDVYHITSDDISYCALALPGRRTVLTVHDLNLLEYYPAGPLKRHLLLFIWYYLPLKRVAKVTCISRKTYEELIKYFPWVASKTVIIGDPYDSAMSYSPKSFQADKPVILHVGTRPNKNLNRVIKALEGIPCHLRIIGNLDVSQKEDLSEASLDYSCASGLSDLEIVEEYRKSDIVSFPSLYEGFGMPVIEGFATGRVVVTSRLEPMVSVAGGAAVLVDPKDTSSIREGFQSVIRDSGLREDLIAKGRARAQSFSVSEIKALYCKVYEGIAGNNDGHD